MSERKPLRLARGERDQIRDAAESRGMDYNELLDEALPEANEETVLERPGEDMVTIMVTPDSHSNTHSLAGENVAAREALVHYLDDYLEEGFDASR